MAITRSQQAKQMLQDGGRIGLKAGRNPMAQFDNLPSGYKTSQKNKEALERQREGLRESIRESRRDDFIDKLTNVIPIVSTIKKIQKANPEKTISNYYDTKVLPYLKRNPNMNQLTKDQYIRLRTMGEVDAMGRPIKTDDDDDNQIFLPNQGIMNQAPGDMDQVSAEELSPIQQAILDRGTASAFLATGGRVGFKGGADMGTVSTDTRKATAKSVDISPSGNVTTSRDLGPDPVDDRGSDIQNLVQAAVGAGATPEQINRITDPNVIDKIRGSRFNNPVTRGLGMAGLYALNPSLAGVSLKEFLKAKSMMDNLKGLQGLSDIFSTERENRAGGGPVGGIMDLESGRQMYFLGKLVKKATRAVKKIAKSPVGKAAIIAGLGYYGGGGRMPFTEAFKESGFGGAKLFGEGSFFSKANPLLFSAKDGEQVFSPFKASALFALSPLIFQEDTNESDYQKFLAERGKGAQLPAPIPTIRDRYRDYMATAFLADGGRPEPVAKKTMPLLDMDGQEKDYRETGGFVDMGRMERADDVPARLSKNEFVFTADAVRNAGEGDIDKGAEVMYNMMKNLEAGGEVSEESQGLEGARKMFQTSQRLEEVL